MNCGVLYGKNKISFTAGLFAVGCPVWCCTETKIVEKFIVMESDSAGVIQRIHPLFYMYSLPDAYQELTTCYSQEDMACKKKVLQVNKSRKYSAVDWKGAAI